jgi:hypothetical protein
MLQKLAAKFGRKASARLRPTARPCLEELEGRLTPSTLVSTYTDVSVQVAPSFFSGTVKETVTATVKNVPSFDPTTGQTTPVPSGAGPASGTVLFNLNNQMQNAQLNSNGQATVSFTLPIFAVLTSQTLEADYLGTPSSITPPDFIFNGSTFLAPLYMNFNNILFSATLTFGQLTPQQTAPPMSNPIGGQPTSLPLFNTAQGETDSFGIVNFLYIDPGVINQVEVFGFTLPGSFAAQLNAFGPQFSGQNSSSGSM